MKAIKALRRALRNLEAATTSLAAIEQGIANQSDFLNHRFEEIIAGLANQSDLLNRRFEEIVVGLDHQSDLLNRKLEQIITHVDRHSGLFNDKINQLTTSLSRQSDLLRQSLDMVLGAARSAEAEGSGVLCALQAPPQETATSTLHEAMQQIPLLLADRTYNTSHPDYDARIVRNFPGHIFNDGLPCENAAFKALKHLAQASEVVDQVWEDVLKNILEEAKSVSYADQVFERRRFVEEYMSELTNTYSAHYVPGWVNLDDGLFLYWLVRQVKPKTIVQTGVCNGLSAAFMMLGLVKNGDEGTLHVIDLPPVFNPKDTAWTVKGKVYGVVIPEGKTSGWLVPDAYRDRFEVWNGDATDLLPKMVDKLDSIDLFYHDSDHTYNHMMFEFRQAKRKLNKGGLVVGDDISWNASLWDFADEFGVPSYNFKGAVGVAFF
jgi:predicted O-methyltransferase YrrM